MSRRRIKKHQDSGDDRIMVEPLLSIYAAAARKDCSTVAFANRDKCVWALLVADDQESCALALGQLELGRTSEERLAAERDRAEKAEAERDVALAKLAALRDAVADIRQRLLRQSENPGEAAARLAIGTAAFCMEQTLAAAQADDGGKGE